MKTGQARQRYAFTLVELMAVIGIMAILIFAVAIALADSQKGFNTLYNRANRGMRVDAIIARNTFESTVRKSVAYCDLATDGSYAQVYYYHNPLLSARLDAYTRFYVAGGQLKADYGNLAAGTWTPANTTGTMTLAENVQSVLFRRRGIALDMLLVLNDGNRQLTVASSAVRNNK